MGKIVREVHLRLELTFLSLTSLVIVSHDPSLASTPAVTVVDLEFHNFTAGYQSS